MPKLVYIGKVVLIEPIPNAEKIERAEVVVGHAGRWSGCVQKNTFQVGDLARVYLQDSILPQTNEFMFMARHQYRVRMARFLGVPSECLIMPYTGTGAVGDDITEACGVIKYDKPLPATIGGEISGNFPSFIPKTDEPNFQTTLHLVEALQGLPWLATVKCDGTSTTAYKYQNHFGVCSRNYELHETSINSLWQIARDYNLIDQLPDGLALQWETVGPGIQGNPMGLNKVEPRLFNVYDINSHSYLCNAGVFHWAELLGMPAVPVAASGDNFNMSANELRKLAEGVYPNNKPREGIVIRPQWELLVANERLSFKVINLLYKD